MDLILYFQYVQDIEKYLGEFIWIDLRNGNVCAGFGHIGRYYSSNGDTTLDIIVVMEILP